VLGVASILAPPGCDYSARRSEYEALPGVTSQSLEAQISQKTSKSAPKSASNKANVHAADSEMQKTLVDGTMRLIESAATTPGGDHFQLAIDNLNHYFESTDPQSFVMSGEAREYLKSRVPASLLAELENPEFKKRDGRHLEDCLLYHTISARVAGTGDELSRVRTIFEWIVQQVQLVPDGSLAPPKMPQVQARPYDVLLRGMATEQGGAWSERGWLFVALCRQLGIDAGLLIYTPKNRKADEGIPWICGAVIDQKVYLFDARIGMPIPGPDGQGVATLEEAATNPAVLAQLDLPGQSNYGPTAADLAAHKVTVLIDSTLGYLSPRMMLLQERLAGKSRMVLYRDPAAQRDAFQEAMGDRFGGVELWKMPISVDVLLFQDPKFVEATQYPIRYFDARLPLLSARLDQLRGEIESAKEKYLNLRFAEKLTLNDREKTPVTRETQHALDMYATYFLALCQLDQDHADQAVMFCRQTLELMPLPRMGVAPEPWRAEPYYHMFRWGAQSNLARLCESKGQGREAIAYYCEMYPTPQYHGNLFRARDLVWRDPSAALPEPLPPAPPEVRPAGVAGAGP
jgi:hypothetical protein